MQQAINYIKNELSGLYPKNEISSFTNLLIEEITGFTRTEIIVNKNTIFSNQQHLLLNSFIEKLKINTPIQYIIGKTEFLGLEFIVNQSVLIPRPETEELVEWIVTSFDKFDQKSILDIGTGSGCIAIGLKSMLSNAIVTGYDVSQNALDVAIKNAEINGLEISFEQLDILNPKQHNHKWDIIVSNPPYIPEKEKISIMPNVVDFEPHLALFVPDNDPLVFYKAIAKFATKNLNSNGHLFFEAHRDWANNIVELLESLGFSNIVLRKDLSGNDRMIKAIKS